MNEAYALDLIFFFKRKEEEWPQRFLRQFFARKCKRA
jgi:hypothetical protein